MTTTADLTTTRLEEGLRRVLRDGEPLNLTDVVNPFDGFALYRILLGRNPNPDSEMPRLLSGELTLREVMTDLMSSREFSYHSGYFPPEHRLMSEANGFRFWFNSSDREMGVLMGLGQYEPETTDLLRKLAKPGMRCLDIGAQTGFYTCLMASQVGDDGHVDAFEPMPASYELLVRNLEENHFESVVSAHHVACSSEKRVLEASFVSNMFVAGDVHSGQHVSMEAIRVDDLIHEPIDLIKIDIEGHEPAAIGGMKGVLRNRPIIVTEANEYWLRTLSQSSGQQYVRLLMSFGYDVFNLDALERPIDPASFHLEILRNVNLLALPRGINASDVIR